MPQNKISNGLVSEDWRPSACCHCHLCSVPQAFPQCRARMAVLRKIKGGAGSQPRASSALKKGICNRVSAPIIFSTILRKKGRGVIPFTSQWLTSVVRLSTGPVPAGHLPLLLLWERPRRECPGTRASFSPLAGRPSRLLPPRAVAGARAPPNSSADQWQRNPGTA